MISKKLVDYLVIDQDTNLKFAIDVEGRKYLLPPDLTMPDIPSITLSGLVVTISGIDIFNEVNVEPPEVYVTVSGLSEKFYEEVYLQGYNSSNFPNINNYYPIPYTTYTVQPNETLVLTSLVAVQDRNKQSILAFYRDGVREREIPFITDLGINFEKGHRYYEGETVSIKIKPGDKRTRVQVYADGYIMEE